MAKKDVIAVVGATGAQGGGLARAILKDPDSRFSVRAVVRKANSPAANELKKMGAEVVMADLDNPEAVKRAFQGAYGAFCVTFYWEHFSPDKEKAHVSSMARAAHDAHLRHTIWSTLDDTRKLVPLADNRMPTLMGKYKVPHFDAKGESDQQFRNLGVPTTFLQTSFYWDNFIHFGMGPKLGPDGTLALTMPLGNAKMPSIAAEDIGGCAYAIFKRGGEFIGRTVGIAGGHLSGAEMAEAFTKALGKHVRYNAVSPEEYRHMGFPGAEDLGNMFQYKRDFEREYRASRDVDFTRQLYPGLQTFDAWLARNKGAIPVGQVAGAS